MNSYAQSPAVMRVIFALQSKGKSTERNGDAWQCQCPAHEDEHPSFAVGVDAKDGKALVVCRAGCSQAAVITALGMLPKDLFLSPDEQAHWQGGRGYIPGTYSSTSSAEEKSNKHRNISDGLDTDLKKSSSSQDPGSQDTRDTTGEAVGLTLDAYAAAKHLPKEFLQRLGLTTVYLSGLPVVSTPYKDHEGVVRAVQFRRALHKGDHEDGRFLWSRKGTTPLLYGLWRTESLSEAKDMIITEGASDCQTLWLHDLPALGLPGAESWREDWATVLDGYERLYIVREPDKGGEAIEDWVTISAIRHRVWFVDLGRFKDPSGLYLDSPERFKERWSEAVSQATSWAEAYHARVLKDVSRLYRNIKPLLEAPNLIDQLRTAINDMGYVGDAWAPMLVYLILTSRLLDRPMNGAVIGPPSVGKNIAVDIAREFLPTEEFHAFEASSPLALIYDDADLRHKAVLVGELDSLPDDGPAGSAIRSLAQNNQTVYDVVEKDPKGGKFRTRRICREGPTVLLTTGTKSPAPQLQTRMLEIHLQDDPELTHAIIERQAEERGLEIPKKPDLQPWKDLQKWLALQASRVRIPFASAIAKALRVRVKYPPTRLRRDYPKLLTCIEVVTLLYQCQRTRTLGGDLLATLGDYAAACTLLEPVFGSIVHEGVTAAIRDTVAGVMTLLGTDPPESKTVSESELAKHLQLSKTATQYRVRRSLAGGWLVNLEDRKGRAAKLVLGAPLPDDDSILPPVEEVEQYWKGTIPNSGPVESSVGQSVNDSVSMENIDRTESPEADWTSTQIVGHPIVHQVNDVAATEILGWTTDLSTPPDIPPSPSPLEGEKIPPNSPLFDFPATLLDGLMTGYHPETVYKMSPEAWTSSNGQGDEIPESPPSPSKPPKKKAQTSASAVEPPPHIEVGPTVDRGPYDYIHDAGQLEKVLPAILEAKTVALDTETTGLDPLTDALRLVQLSTPTGSYVIDAFHCPLQMLAPALEGDRWLIGHNLKFDLKFLTQAGLPWPAAKLLDTQLSTQVLGAGKTIAPKDTYTLQALVEKHLQRTLDKDLQTSDWGQPVLSQEQLAYAARDAQVLLLLAEVLTTQLRKERLWVTATLESSCAMPFAWMELAGMPVDVVAWQAQAEYQARRAHELRDELTALTGQQANWSSWQQVLPILQGRGIPVSSTNNDALIPYVSDDVVVKLLEYRKASKAAGTYGMTWLGQVHPKTGRIHSDFFQLGTAVGRSSSRAPNVQNLPRDALYRQLFSADEGRCLIKADYSQLHLRIASVMAPDASMQEAFQRGVDLHRRTAAGLRQGDVDHVTSEDRQLAKALNFGLIYAMGAARLQKQAWTDYGVRLTEAEAQAHKQAWFTLYPGIRRWHNREQSAISRDHITETRSYRGRRRTGITYLPDRLSSPVLGVEADGMKAAMAALFAHRDEVPSAKLINCIHDELLVECDHQEADTVEQWLQVHMERAMQEAVQEKTATPVDVHRGQTWAG